ncbi:outer membrane protein assembly factor BamE [Janthinobacterium sp. SUN176]|uniref:outer membrane protein assembly factor BamE domain-containing protein n=1 Tax=unclassified Janthinobacterium TaxID=2610881 RepID=UPI0025B024FB|nr:MULTISPECIES: outer membrane protein assembly factor BamE [unclassified Janthinobacterium]MDN2678653.1 outer membrane protein assembly factor BamE [Janthinobacterium sp. SUN033]MDO8074578.1 outer membrane protein assembly factor BamE [Janthinobacterium sp. SUN176]
MKWLSLILLTLLAACSGTRALQASKNVPYATLEQTVQVGNSTREQVRAALGDSTSIRFDSGKEVWMYTYPAASGAQGEYVILFGGDGVVKQVRGGEVYQVRK